MNPPIVRTISECFIKPQYPSEEPYHPPLYLAPWDLAFLSMNYIQKGLVFIKPTTTNDKQPCPVKSLLEKLKESLVLTLVHFYPLAGRLATQKRESPPSYTVYIDCNNSPGAKLIYATANVTVSEILSPVDVPLVVQSFFDHDRAINHDGHFLSLLSIQVTELIDGIFIGCSTNHVIADGTSYWHFFNILSNTFRALGSSTVSEITRPPIHNRWFPSGHGPILNLPFTHHDQFTSRFEAPHIRERIFHFSSQSISNLKSKANSECKTDKISSFQAVSALVWTCIVQARGFPRDQETYCTMAVNNRTRLHPPLPNEYFGNSVQIVGAKATAGELQERGFGWAAWRLHETVAGQSDAAARRWAESWVEGPFVNQLGQLFNRFTTVMASSPRFPMYENEFGMGKPVAVRSGRANKSDGNVTFYPGCEGRGSMDLEVCLSPEVMRGLECDREFVDVVSVSTHSKS